MLRFLFGIGVFLLVLVTFLSFPSERLVRVTGETFLLLFLFSIIVLSEAVFLLPTSELETTRLPLSTVLLLLPVREVVLVCKLRRLLLITLLFRLLFRFTGVREEATWFFL